MRRQIIIAVAVSVAVTALFFVFLLRPKLEEISEVREEIQAAATEEQTLRNRLARLEEARQRAPEMIAQLERLVRMLPSDPDLPGFIRLAQGVSEGAGVDLLSIAPARPADLAGATGIQTIAVTLTFEGTFRQVENFLARLETMDRVVEVRTITLTPETDDVTRVTTLRGSLSLQMYVVGEEARVTTTPAGESPPQDDAAQEEEAAS